MIETIPFNIFSIALCILLGAIMYGLKGGQHGSIRYAILKKIGVKFTEDKESFTGDLTRFQKLVKFVLGGKFLSSMIFTAFVHFAANGQAWNPIFEVPFFQSWGSWLYALTVPLAAGFWLAAVAPSMGEEAGGVGGYKGAWGQYIYLIDVDGKPAFGRSFAVKKALQRGIWTGAIFATMFWDCFQLYPAALLPVAMYIGISIEQWRTKGKSRDWWIHEFIFGGILMIGFLKKFYYL